MPRNWLKRKGNQQLDAEHLLWALLEDEDGVASQILKKIGVNTQSLRKDVEGVIDKFPKVIGATPLGQIYVSPRLKQVMETAEQNAQHLKDDYTSVEHLLMALTSVGGHCSDLLNRYGAGVRQDPLCHERDQGGTERDRP